MLSGKIVVITGGSGLLGAEFVKAVAENNGIAIVADIDKAQAAEVASNINSELGIESTDYAELDITSEDSISSLILYLDQKYGKIDALVNSAYPRNKNYGSHFFDVSYEDFVSNVGMNLGGYFATSKAFSRYFKKQGHGNIINLSSIYGVIAPKFEIYRNTGMTTPVEYAAIKSGLVHPTKYMAKYLKGSGVRVNAISPGGILDSQPELFLNAYNAQCSSKGMLSESDIKGTLLYLLSDLSQYVNGQNIIVDDGMSL